MGPRFLIWTGVTLLCDWAIEYLSDLSADGTRISGVTGPWYSRVPCSDGNRRGGMPQGTVTHFSEGGGNRTTVFHSDGPDGNRTGEGQCGGLEEFSV